jgi:uncharacterized membrane protein YgdD (TMEM256/DUF423 family)
VTTRRGAHVAPSVRPRWPAVVGAIGAGLAVALGAFGAHALEGALTPARAATFETAVRYQFLHALALLALDASRAAGATPHATARTVAIALTVGTGVFSGALYALVATDIGAFGAIAPIGGILLLVGWGAWAWGLARRRT